MEFSGFLCYWSPTFYSFFGEIRDGRAGGKFRSLFFDFGNFLELYCLEVFISIMIFLKLDF